MCYGIPHAQHLECLLLIASNFDNFDVLRSNVVHEDSGRYSSSIPLMKWSNEWHRCWTISWCSVYPPRKSIIMRYVYIYYIRFPHNLQFRDLINLRSDIHNRIGDGERQLRVPEDKICMMCYFFLPILTMAYHAPLMPTLPLEPDMVGVMYTPPDHVE